MFTSTFMLYESGNSVLFTEAIRRIIFSALAALFLTYNHLGDSGIKLKI